MRDKEGANDELGPGHVLSGINADEVACTLKAVFSYWFAIKLVDRIKPGRQRLRLHVAYAETGQQ